MTDGVVTGSVIEVVKGGLIVDIGLRGFLPASLIELRRVRDLTPYLGQEIEAKILELDKNRNNVVLSPPRAARADAVRGAHHLPQQPRTRARSARASSRRSSTSVRSSTSAASTASCTSPSCRWKHIEHASEVVEVGQEVTVEILEVDLERERVSLSLKATQEDPWQVFARTHAIGQVAPGKVTKLVPFGAFVRVAEGIEGLVHISELSGKHVELAEQVVSVGDEVFVKVIDIDLERRRISLILKQANEGVDPERHRVRPGALRHAHRVRRAGQLQVPRGLRPGDQRVARGLRRPSARSGSRSTPQPRLAGRLTRSRSPRPPNEARRRATSAAARLARSRASPARRGTLADDEALAALREKLSSELLIVSSSHQSGRIPRGPAACAFADAPRRVSSSR